MKKILLISIILSAMLTSCQDDVINTLDGNTIRFNNNFVEHPTTRAADITTSNLTFFVVHGWMTEIIEGQLGNSANIFDNVEVRRISDNKWTYDGGGRYWFANKRYDFLAFSPIQARYTLADDRATINFENTAEYDFIHASQFREIDATVDDPDDVMAVALDFSHLLSRVVVQFVNVFDVPDVYLRIDNLLLTGAANLGSLALADTVWTSTAHALVLNPKFPANSTNNRLSTSVEVKSGNSAATEHFYLIPEAIDADDYQLTFDLTVYQGAEDAKVEIGKYQHSVNLAAMTFERGTNYRLSAKFNHKNVNPESALEQVEFAISVTPWGEDIQNEIF